MKIIDLSLTLYENMPVYPNDPEVRINVVHTHSNNGWELREITMGSHTGTHVDAFSHMHKGMQSLNEIPLSRFFGPAQVVEINANWPNDIGLFFIEEIDINLSDKLISSRPNFVGGNITEALERKLLKHEIVTYTNLKNLNLIQRNTTFTFYGFPLKIKEGDGSPVRAIAIIE